MTEDLYPRSTPDHETPAQPAAEAAEEAPAEADQESSPSARARQGVTEKEIAARATALEGWPEEDLTGAPRAFRQQRVVAAKPLSDERSSVSTITSAYDRINAILSELSPAERGAMLDALK